MRKALGWLPMLNVESALRALAEERGITIFFLESDRWSTRFGLRKGDSFGEFELGGMTLGGALSNGFDFGALEYEQEDLLKEAIELVSLLAEGRLRVSRRKGWCRTYEVVETPLEILTGGRRSKRPNWWLPGGPFERTFGPIGR